MHVNTKTCVQTAMVGLGGIRMPVTFFTRFCVEACHSLPPSPLSPSTVAKKSHCRLLEPLRRTGNGIWASFAHLWLVQPASNRYNACLHHPFLDHFNTWSGDTSLHQRLPPDAYGLAKHQPSLFQLHIATNSRSGSRPYH